jgi:hypothetical protein
MGLLQKIIRAGKRRCLKNYPKLSPLAGWRNPMKLRTSFYIYAAMKLLLLPAVITRLTEAQLS